MENELKSCSMISTKYLILLSYLVSQGFASPVLNPRGTGKTLKVTNNCDITLWPGLSGVVRGSGAQFFGRAGSSNPAGFKLDSKTSKSIWIPGGTDSVRVWARAGCSWRKNPSWPQSRFVCDTGDCGSPNNGFDESCYMTGGQGANTLAEFTLDTDGKLWYDISLVDGFTFPVSMTLSGNLQGVGGIPDKFNCKNPACFPDYSKCPPELLKKDQWGNNIGCFSIRTAINDNDLKAKTPKLQEYYNNNWVRSHTECSCGVGSCAGQTRQEVLSNLKQGNTPLVDATGFCCSPNNDLYNADGIRNHICYATDKPMPLNNFGGGKRYDQILKDICPEAYSWEFDDENSTYQCYGDLTVEVTFCPAGAAPPVPRPQPTSSGWGWDFYDGYDITGHDLGSRVAASSSTDCQPYCFAASGCAGYSFSNGWCYLKSGPSSSIAVVAASGVNSAIINAVHSIPAAPTFVGYGWEFYDNIDIPGHDLSGVARYADNSGNRSGCQTVCGNTAGCIGYTWFDGWCYFKGGQRSDIKEVKATSGMYTAFLIK
ncbi:hypothetical protein HK098_003838 [Nowakowskiella sp. JEL0407]|nr:hypothetical protein HK098_003838 [Nowakowskiella sp. JEL0407]